VRSVLCRVSEQTRNEIRHVVDLCNDHAPIKQVRTAQPQSQPQPQPTRQHPTQCPQAPQQAQQQWPPPQRQPPPSNHSPDMQRLLAFGGQQDNFRVQSV